MSRALTVAALAFSAGLTSAASPAFAAGDAAAGEAVYQSACARCHRSVERIVPLFAGQEASATAAYLDRFLADHKAPDASSRADLIAYLLKVSGL